MSNDEPKCHFHSLPDELVIQVLGHCTVEDVLRVEQTSRRLRRACQSREVWLAMLQTLAIEFTPVLPPNVIIDALSAAELRHRVLSSYKRAYTFGHHRDLADKKSTPDLTNVHARVVDVPLDKAHANRDLIVKPRLLPGGSEAFVVHRGRLELVSLPSGHCVWQVPSVPDRPTLRCFAFDFEYVKDDEGQLGNLIDVAVIDGEFGVRENSQLRVFRYNLRRRQHRLLSAAITTPGFLSSLCIRQGYVLLPHVRMSTGVLDCNTGKYLCLSFVDEEAETFDPLATFLADGQIVVVVRFPYDEDGAYISGGDSSSGDSGYDADISSGSGSDSRSMRSGGSSNSGSDSDEAGISRCSAIKVDISDLGAENWKDDMDDALQNPVVLRITEEDRGSPTIVELPFLGADFWENVQASENDSGLRPLELEGPYIFAHHSFVSNWVYGSPTELIIAACLSEWDYEGDERDRFHLLSYHLRIARDTPSSPAKLSLMKATRATAPSIAWNPSSMTNNGRIVSFFDSSAASAGGDASDTRTRNSGSSMLQYALFSETQQPLRRLMLDRVVMPPKTPTLTTVDPWTGAIAIRTPARLRVIYIDEDEEGQLSTLID